MDWQPGEAPPIILSGPFINVHSTSAEVRWTTDRPASTELIDIDPDDNIEVIKSVIGYEHKLWISRLYPGDTYSVQFRSCNSVGCSATRSTAFTTKPGCLQISFFHDGRLQNPDWWNNEWDRPIRLDIGGVSPKQYQIRIRALVDTAAAASSSARWEPHTITHIGDLSYQASLPDFTHGGLRSYGDTVGRYQLTKSGTIASDGGTDIYYSLPVFKSIDVRSLSINLSITGGRGRYNGHESGICPSNTATEKYGNVRFSYRPTPLSTGQFQVTEGDVRLWESIKDEEAKRKWTDDAMLNAFGFLPAPYWFGVALTVGQIALGYNNLDEADVSTIDNFIPIDNENVKWTVYSIAGVGVNGQATAHRSYYVMYGRRIVTSPEGQTPPIIEPRVWQGIVHGYPRWLIGSSAQVKFTDCQAWNGSVLNPEACMGVESFSPIELQAQDTNGNILDKHTNTLGGMYSVIPESDGGIGEDLWGPSSDYTYRIHGVASAPFSLFFIRPYQGKWQGILYDQVPIQQSQTLSLVIPSEGYVPALQLPNGQNLWPVDFVSPKTNIIPDPIIPNGNNGWYTQDITITTQAFDNLTGIAHTLCQINDTTWFTYTQQFIISEERGDNQASCYSTDNAGAQEDLQKAFFKLDKTPPTTTVSITGTLGQNGWFTSTVEVIFQSYDATSGIDYTQYRINGSQWMKYNQRLYIESEGVHILEFRSVDRAGNIEQDHSQQVKIDKTPPQLDAWLNQLDYLRLDMLTLNYTATDRVSGVYTVTANLLGDAITKNRPYELLWPPVGQHTLSVVAQDFAGWTSSQSLPFSLSTNLERLRATILRLRVLKEIDRDGIVNGLTTKVDGAITAYQRGKINVAINHINALIHEVEGIRDHRITVRGADLLVDDSSYIQEHIR
ncbi:hypothetical protein SE18_25810 [Herpetosiphon geysericola]|uniref:Fibronectin type-III domain-containing protein n=2 Tax=Herpetosiphon geysericola TaxID=70996 RepID=A0A0P6XWS6_9CHLR|nr:hypothetical protein SE18_25810 [Herpetosiphon geysericola]